MLTELDNWFTHEVLPHEAALMLYLGRVLEGAHRLRSTAPKLNVLVDEFTPERRASIQQQLARVTAAINDLPNRCPSVFWLRRSDSLSQKEIAAVLGISEGTVERHMVRAARLLAALLSSPRTVPIPSGMGPSTCRGFSTMNSNVRRRWFRRGTRSLHASRDCSALGDRRVHRLQSGHRLFHGGLAAADQNDGADAARLFGI